VEVALLEEGDGFLAPAGEGEFVELGGEELHGALRA
jgi:hypothetical protein